MLCIILRENMSHKHYQQPDKVWKKLQRRTAKNITDREGLCYVFRNDNLITQMLSTLKKRLSEWKSCRIKITDDKRCCNKYWHSYTDRYIDWEGQKLTSLLTIGQQLWAIYIYDTLETVRKTPLHKKL